MAFSGSLLCLHGFLGTASDWEGLIPERVYAVRMNLFGGANSLEKTADFDTVQASLSSKLRDAPRPYVLIGYSMGGRIALHALVSNSNFWDGAILIGAHPGLSDEEDRRLRFDSDKGWARRFEEESWKDVIEHWNSQPIFRRGIVFQRKEREFSRQALSAGLRGLSLGNQQNLRPQIRDLKLPLLWMAGENDEKFVKIALEMNALNSQIKVAFLPNAGHRAPWEQPLFFRDCVRRFLEEEIRHE